MTDFRIGSPQDSVRGMRLWTEEALDGYFSDRVHTGKNAFAPSAYSDIDSFFEEASDDYDSDLTSPYWSYSHEVLRYMITSVVADAWETGKRISMLDAGAGTGNWSRFAKDIMPNARITCVDRNRFMLRRAHAKFRPEERSSVSFVEANLEELDKLFLGTFDLIICFHNVIGMARSTPRVLAQLRQRLAPGGRAMIMTPNKYHAFLFLLEQQNELELERVAATGTVRFKRNMPEMFCYTPRELARTLSEAGFARNKVFGFPVLLAPEQCDADLKVTLNRTTSAILRDRTLRAQMLQAEKQVCFDESLAYRAGNSLLAVCYG